MDFISFIKLSQIGIIFNIFGIGKLKLKLIKSYLKYFSQEVEELEFNPNFSMSIHWLRGTKKLSVYHGQSTTVCQNNNFTVHKACSPTENISQQATN